MSWSSLTISGKYTCILPKLKYYAACIFTYKHIKKYAVVKCCFLSNVYSDSFISEDVNSL
jgi:hypothetical protein